MARKGWKPTPFDGRDYPLELAHIEANGFDPANKVTLPHPFAARDQRKVPCCVSCSIAVAMECLDQFTPPARELSPLYHYWKTRAQDNREDKLVDLTLREGLQAAVDYGIAALKRHNPPYDRDGALTTPTAAADASARQRRLATFDPVSEAPAYFAVSGPAQWISALRNGMPIIIGYWITSAYRSITPANPTHGPVPAESSTTGHSVSILGFDEQTSAFLAKDSQGTGWGDQGRWWMPFAVADSNLVDSAFALGRIVESD